ncbi:MAG: glycosyltransferase family 4 protein [Candidatus Aenigmatarchaeota archaeon]
MSLNSVLFLTQKYEKGAVDLEYCREMSSHLSEKEIDSHMVCFGGNEKDWEENELNVHEFSFKLDGDNYFSWAMLIQTEFLRKIKELVRIEDVSLLHANEWATVPAGLVASKLYDIPLIITYHSIEEERGMNMPHSGHISELERQGLEKASYILVHSETTREALDVYDMPEGKVKLIKRENGWREKIWEIYKHLAKVHRNNKKMRATEGAKNENFDAYVGVSSS